MEYLCGLHQAGTELRQLLFKSNILSNGSILGLHVWFVSTNPASLSDRISSLYCLWCDAARECRGFEIATQFQASNQLQGYITLFIVAPLPREPLRSEKSFTTIEPDGNISPPKSLPSWQEGFDEQKKALQKNGDFSNTEIKIEEAEVFMSLVVPAYNEEKRLGIMLAEAVDYLQREYGDSTPKTLTNGTSHRSKGGRKAAKSKEPIGWEILIVSDGSTDKTIETALRFARDLGGKSSASIRVISLQQNRGKGGAVTHGMRHVRGKYTIFADADGASKFDDLGKLVQASQEIEDVHGRGVAVGSRAYLVGSEAVARVSVSTPLSPFSPTPLPFPHKPVPLFKYTKKCHD